MRGFPSFNALACTAVVLAFACPLLAGPAKPRERSFRPIVPIKQNIRGGLDQMKSQTVRLTIPPPPIPEQSPPVEVEALQMTRDVETSLLPPEPAPSDLQDPAASVEKTQALDDSTGIPEAPEKHEDKESSKHLGPTLSQLREEAHLLAGKKLHYVFGADDPDSGGLDCSSTIQYLLTQIGIKGVPRTSYDQYEWLKGKKLLDDVYGKSAPSKLLKKLSPGDLIFWGGTWKSGHRVSHVMLYMGYDPAADKHYVFGARSKSTTGLTGSGVDIFELNTESGRLVAHGKIPGLVYE